MEGEPGPMTWFELIRLTESEAVYDYFPESRSAEPGRVVFNRATCFPDKVIVAPSDRFSSYMFHLIRKLEEFNDSGDFMRSGYVAWC